MKKWTEQQVIDSLIEASIEYPALDAKTICALVGRKRHSIDHDDHQCIRLLA